MLVNERLGSGKTSLATKMEIFTFRFHNWCRLHGINHGQPFIGMGHLSLTDYAELRLKAYASRVMVAYLAVVLTSLCSEQSRAGTCSKDLQLVTTATTQFANWSLLVERYPYDLSGEQAERLHRDGHKLLGLNS